MTKIKAIPPPPQQSSTSISSAAIQRRKQRRAMQSNTTNMQKHNEGERKTIGLELVASPELLSANTATVNNKKKWSPGRKKKGSSQSSNKAAIKIEKTSSTSPMKNKFRRLSSSGVIGSPTTSLAKSHVNDSAHASLSSIEAPTSKQSTTAKVEEEGKKTSTSSSSTATIKLQKNTKDTPTQTTKNRRLQLLRTVKSKKKSKSTFSTSKQVQSEDNAVVVNEDEMIGPLDEVLANRYEEKNGGKEGSIVERSTSPTSMNSNVGYEIPFTSPTTTEAASDTVGNLKINSSKKASASLRTLQDPAIVRDRSTLANRRSQASRKMSSSSQGRLGALPRSSNALSSSPLLDPTMSDYFCTPTVSSSNIHDATTIPTPMASAGMITSTQTTPERQVSDSSTQATPDNNQGTPDDKLQSQVNNDSPTGVNEIEQVLEAPTPITSNETNPSSNSVTISAEKSNEKKTTTNRQHKSFVELDEESNKQRLMLLTKNTSRLLAQGDEVKASLYVSDMKTGGNKECMNNKNSNQVSFAAPVINNSKKKKANEPLLPTTGIDLVDEMTKVFVDCLIGSNDTNNIVGYDDETETNMDESTAIDTATVDDDDSTVPPERQEELPKPRELFNETKQYQDTTKDTAAVIAEVTDTPMFNPSWEELTTDKEGMKKKVGNKTPDTSKSQEGVGIEDLFKRNKFDSPLRDDVEDTTSKSHELKSSRVCENTTSFTLNDDTTHLKEVAKKDDESDVSSRVASDVSSKVAPPKIQRDLNHDMQLFEEPQNNIATAETDEMNEEDGDCLQPLPSFDNSTVDDDLTLDSSLQSSLTSTRDESLLTPMTNHSDSDYNPIPSWFEDVVDKIGDAVGIDNQCGEIHSDDEYSDTEYPMDEDRSPRRRHRQRKSRSSRQSKSLHQRSRDLHRRRQQRKSRHDNVLNRVRSSSPSASLHRRTDSERDYLVSFSPGTIPELDHQGHDNMADDDSYGEVHKLSQAPAIEQRVQTSPSEGRRTSANRVDRLSRSFGHGKVNRLVRQWSAKSEGL